MIDFSSNIRQCNPAAYAVRYRVFSRLSSRGKRKDGLGISRFRFGDALDRALEQLVPAGGWRLSLADDPSEAAPFLEEMLGQVERQA